MTKKPQPTEVSLDRRGAKERRTTERRKDSAPVAVERRNLERRAKVPRRRQIDPTTCERDYSSEEVEFMNAMDAYKRKSGRMFPTCSEILEVLRELGYRKVQNLPPASREEAVSQQAAVANNSPAGPSAGQAPGGATPGEWDPPATESTWAWEF